MNTYVPDPSSSFERAYRTVPFLKTVLWSGISEILRNSNEKCTINKRELVKKGASLRLNCGNSILSDLDVSTLECCICGLSSGSSESNLKSGNPCDFYRLQSSNNISESSKLPSKVISKITVRNSTASNISPYLQNRYSDLLSTLINESIADIFRIRHSEVYDSFTFEWTKRRSEILESCNLNVVGGFFASDNIKSIKGKLVCSGMVDYKVNPRAWSCSILKKSDSYPINMAYLPSSSDEYKDEHLLILNYLLPKFSLIGLTLDEYILRQKSCITAINTRMSSIKDLSLFISPKEYVNDISTIWNLLESIVGSSPKTVASERQIVCSVLSYLELLAVDIVDINNNAICSMNKSDYLPTNNTITLPTLVEFGKCYFQTRTSNSQSLKIISSFPSKIEHYWFLAYWAFRIGGGHLLLDLTELDAAPKNFNIVCECLALRLISTSKSLVVNCSHSSRQLLINEENWVKYCLQLDASRDFSAEIEDLNMSFHNFQNQLTNTKPSFVAFEYLLASIVLPTVKPLTLSKLLPDVTVEDYIWYRYHIMLKSCDDSSINSELNELYFRLKNQGPTYFELKPENSNTCTLGNTRDDISGDYYISSFNRPLIESEISKVQSDNSKLADFQTLTKKDLLKIPLSETDIIHSPKKHMNYSTSLGYAKVLCYALHIGEALKWIYDSHPNLRNIVLQWVLYLTIAGILPLEADFEGNNIIPSFCSKLENFSDSIDICEILLLTIRQCSLPLPFVLNFMNIIPEHHRKKILATYVEFNLIHLMVDDDLDISHNLHASLEEMRTTVANTNHDINQCDHLTIIRRDLFEIIAQISRDRGHYITAIRFYLDAKLPTDAVNILVDCLQLPICTSLVALSTPQKQFFDKLQGLVGEFMKYISNMQISPELQCKITTLKILNKVVYGFVLIQKGMYKDAKEYIENENLIPESTDNISLSNMLYLPKLLEAYVICLFELFRSTGSHSNELFHAVSKAVISRSNNLMALLSMLSASPGVQSDICERTRKLLREVLMLGSTEQLFAIDTC
ncbi:hypothetical protein cand_029710 [Cryptosporidium andersoni]|uniref:Nuclear pore protein n=1 Tax=Cryptosporidium andersoni TaxID=117008 RepID=A0A1J4MNF4_9CRYT|nr:hypothetical protein cand_029710 [Cryptosporidium andersoni]